MSIEVYKNFLKEEDFLQIKNVLFGFDFPWYFNEKITNSPVEQKDNYQLTHIFYDNFQITSSYFYLIEPILKKINPSSILRIKSNFTPRFDNKKEYGFHVDYNNFSGKTAIFYLNNNNGKTIFKDKEIESVENSIVIFKGNYLHSGTTSTDDKRVLINFNFYEWDKDSEQKL